MSTDQPQEENENTPVEAGDQGAPLSSESTELHDSAEGNVEGVVASTDDETAETAETTEDVPQLTLGSGAESDESADIEEKEYVQPTIRGRIDKFGTAIGTGRRKTSVARVRVKEGSGKFTVNGREMKDFFCIERDQKMVMDPVVAVGEQGKIDIWVRVNGGGITGQTGAVVLGIARALQAKNESYHPTLAEGGFLTRDDRMVERKKYGLAKARKSFQFSKR
ncbi:30S ribosomal protein S9 [uncultured Rubinisphaera sp.]|uniref:30S ribosomal protein S9 n=1 Tax=uncultured Rubinisphaera sp. TaxID=1678686 RepID=UPI0030DC55AD|tara:strand:+ start:1436 stop:2101 length:666 start_codon:yes stop_codon:yes gene_type:complete